MGHLFMVFYRFLVSRDLAIILLTVFAIIASVNMLFWQNVTPVDTQLSILTALLTYSFYISGILLSLNLLACSLQRTWQELKEKPLLANPKEAIYLETAQGTDSSRQIQQILEKNGYRKIQSKGSEYLFRKGYGGRWGSILYHASLLLIVLGLFSLNLSRYEGNLFLTQGQSFSPGDKFINDKIPEQELVSDQPFRITLENFDITYLGENAVESAAKIKVEEEGGKARQEQIRINYPLEVQGIKFMLQNFDYAPRFVFSDEGGQAFFDSYVNLFINNGQEDNFEILGSPFSLRVKFYPDAHLSQGKPVNSSNNPIRPLFWVRLQAGNQTLGEKYLRLEEEWRTEIGVLKIADLSRFIQLLVTREEGADVLVIGFAFTTLGLLVRFLRVEKFVFLEFKGQHMVLSGQAEYYQNIFKNEFNELVRQIEKEVA